MPEVSIEFLWRQARPEWHPFLSSVILHNTMDHQDAHTATMHKSPQPQQARQTHERKQRHSEPSLPTPLVSDMAQEVETPIADCGGS